ncbi:MAG: response regulator [Actinobacteria bacterium]|nr:response regulator [Actinomycetota bacterium]MBW3649125.1 response regulator [Actinomycetota bacterium]
MSYRVLVVDDNPDYRLLVRYALDGASDLEVVGEACDAARGITTAAELQPDIVLLDMVMPGMDGLAAVAPLRQAAPAAAIVAVSAYPEHQLWNRSPLASSIGYLSKSVPASRMADELVELARLLSDVDEVVATERRRFAPDLRSAGAARRFVHDTLDRWDCHELLDTATLLVSELVTNAVVHAHSEVELAIHLRPAKVRVEVIDSADAVIHRRNAADEAQSGRGMALIDSLSTGWGIDTLLSGKSVWFEVDRPAGQTA